MKLCCPPNAFCEFESNRYEWSGLDHRRQLKRGAKYLAAEVFAATFLTDFLTFFLLHIDSLLD